jgi:hypothetical protein
MGLRFKSVTLRVNNDSVCGLQSLNVFIQERIFVSLSNLNPETVC